MLPGSFGRLALGGLPCSFRRLALGGLPCFPLFAGCLAPRRRGGATRGWAGLAFALCGRTGPLGRSTRVGRGGCSLPYEGAPWSCSRCCWLRTPLDCLAGLFARPVPVLDSQSQSHQPNDSDVVAAGGGSARSPFPEVRAYRSSSATMRGSGLAYWAHFSSLLKDAAVARQ